MLDAETPEANDWLAVNQLTVTEGVVIAVDYSASPPVVNIANIDTPRNATREQLVAVVLTCQDGCPIIRPGDYIEVAGEKVHEYLYIATSISR